MEPREEFVALTIAIALRGVESGDGGPFGAAVVRGDDVLAEGWNQVTSSNDPTAHAEIVAVRAACERLGTFQLEGCEVYASCEPCPMCLGALYWARPRAVFFAATRHDAAAAGFDDAFVYDELALPPGARALPMRFVTHPEGHAPFAAWAAKPDRVEY
jgi:guanine deaminase